jgi:hypothetical protein
LNERSKNPLSIASVSTIIPSSFAKNDWFMLLQNHQNDHENSDESKTHDHHHHHSEEDVQEEMEEQTEVSDKVLMKTIVGTKALKAGSIFVVGFLLIVLFILVGLAKAGVFLTPIVFPLALLPIGVIALALFIPLLILFVPIVAVGLGGRKRRKKRSVTNENDTMMMMNPFEDDDHDNDSLTTVDQLSRRLFGTVGEPQLQAFHLLCQSYSHPHLTETADSDNYRMMKTSLFHALLQVIHNNTPDIKCIQQRDGERSIF